MKLILLITFFATILRVYLAIDMGNNCCGSDEGLYHFTAQNLAVHNKYVITQADEPHLWKDEIYSIKPPLYPFFLAAIYKFTKPDYKIARAIQILLSTLTGFLIYLIGRELMSKKVGIAALIIYSFFLETAFFGLSILSEGLYWLLLSLYIYLLIRMKVHASNLGIPVGIVSGMLILIRPPSIVFILPIIIWYLWKNLSFRTISNTAVMLLFCFLVVLPWSLRNYQVYGQPVFIYADGGINMWMGNHERSSGIYNVPKPDDPNQTPVLKTTGAAQEVERDNFYYSKSREFIVKNPFQAADLFMGKIFGTFSLYHRRGVALYTINRHNDNPLRPPAKSFDAFLEFVVSYQYVIIILLSALGTFYFYIKKRFSSPVLLLVILILCHLVSIGLTHYEFRYITQLYPLIIPLAAVAACVLLEVLRTIKLKHE